MGTRSRDLGAELRMHSNNNKLIEILSNKGNVPVFIPVTSVEIELTWSETMLAQCFSTLLLKCLMKRLGKSAPG